MSDLIERQAAIDAIENEQKKIMRSDWAIDQAKFSAMSEIRALIADLPSVSTEKLAKAKSEIRCGENKAYNADFTMGCEYAISVIERMFEEVEE